MGTKNGNFLSGQLTMSMDAGAASQIAVGPDSTIFVSAGENLFALDKQGSRKWSRRLESWSNGVHQLVPAQDRLLVIGFSGFGALNTDGADLWNTGPDNIAGISGNTAALTHDGRIWL